jgi:hypothetical protein
MMITRGYAHLKSVDLEEQKSESLVETSQQVKEEKNEKLETLEDNIETNEKCRFKDDDLESGLKQNSSILASDQDEIESNEPSNLNSSESPNNNLVSHFF